MALIGGLFFLPKLGKILDLTEKGIYSIAIEGLFLLYVCIRNLASGNVQFGWGVDDSTKTVPFSTGASMAATMSTFAMAFTVHNAVTEIVRKCKTPASNSKNVFTAYVITYVFYVITGLVGSIAVYQKSNLKINTVFSNVIYTDADTLTIVLLAFAQLATAFQLVTVLPVLNNIVRTQCFIMIYGEEGVPPRWAFISFNILYIISYLIIQIYNVDPSDVMAYGGAFIGFIIVYLLPVGIHLVTLYRKQKFDNEQYNTLNGKRPEIASFMKGKKTNYILEYGIHGAIMSVGVFIFIYQIVDMFKESK